MGITTRIITGITGRPIMADIMGQASLLAATVISAAGVGSAADLEEVDFAAAAAMAVAGKIWCAGFKGPSG